ncbi:MAG TPA: glycerol kinase GlpK [Ramlibacter sp.]|uniref:glycerol kinase GlpK n=1 Tax=Ramlibacter sp. TaxID=1917967 RepID=UPI002ED373FE
MKYVLALDQGTTSSRAIVFDRSGQVVAQAQREFTQIFPQAGWVEHDPNEIWTTQLAVAQEAIEAAGGVHNITSIGITNQRETTLLWERATGEPVANAIVWQDRRTAGRCDELRARGHSARVQQKTGLIIDAYFSGTKLEWLLDNVPGARQRAYAGELAFGTVDSWLIWKLTRGRLHVTDASNASRTMLFNLRTGSWDEDLLKLMRIPANVLPQVVASSAVVANTDASVLGAELPIAGIAGDQQAAMFGQTCWSPGMAKNTYGTGCFMLMNTGGQRVPSRNRLLTTVGWRGPAGPTNLAFCLEGSVFMAGATVQWLRDGLGMIQSAEEVEALAQQVDDTGDVYLVPAFAGLGTPDWDAHARGTIVGMTRGTTRAHIARAALEAIALQSADVFAAMTRDAGLALTELRVDGGASRNNLLMQMQADFLGVPVVRPVVTETTALGAAYLAGLATGFWRDPEEIARQWQVDRRFHPRLPEPQRLAKLARWRDAVNRAKGWTI